MTSLKDEPQFQKVGHRKLPKKYQKMHDDRKKYESTIQYYRTTKGVSLVFRNRLLDDGDAVQERFDALIGEWVPDGYLSVYFNGDDLNYENIDEKTAMKLVEKLRLKVLNLPTGRLYAVDKRIGVFEKKIPPPT